MKKKNLKNALGNEEADKSLVVIFQKTFLWAKKSLAYRIFWLMKAHEILKLFKLKGVDQPKSYRVDLLLVSDLHLLVFFLSPTHPIEISIIFVRKKIFLDIK